MPWGIASAVVVAQFAGKVAGEQTQKLHNGEHVVPAITAQPRKAQECRNCGASVLRLQHICSYCRSEQ